METEKDYENVGISNAPSPLLFISEMFQTASSNRLFGFSFKNNSETPV